MAEKDKDAQASEATPEVERRIEVLSGKHRRCTVDGCDKRCDVYDGDNPFKQDTMVCPDHGRMPVKQA